MKQQDEIKQWFDQTYKSKGLDYLRPVEAYQIFRTILNPQPNSSHLDVACGMGLLLKSFSETKANLYGLDLSEVAIEACRELCPSAEVMTGNAENLPFADEHFDSITCIGSLERMINRDKAIQEQVRVAKPGANFCYMVRNAENFTWKYMLKPLNLYNKKGHQDALNLNQWRSLFEKNGLEVLAIYPDHWPYLKTINTLAPWTEPDYSKIRKFPFNLDWAYEFIFHLRKK